MESDEDLPIVMYVGDCNNAVETDLPVTMDDIIDLRKKSLYSMAEVELLDDHIDVAGVDDQSMQNMTEVLQLEGYEQRDLNKVQQFMSKEQSIPRQHPGVPVFGPQRFCLFDEGIAAEDCGVVCNSEDTTYARGPITMAMVHHLSNAASLRHEEAEWLFYIMSVHSNAQFVERCFEMVSRVALVYTAPCYPSLSHVIVVFKNYGMKINETLLDVTEEGALNSNEQMRDLRTKLVEKINKFTYKPDSTLTPDTPKPPVNSYNVNKVMNVVRIALERHGDRSLYSVEEKVLLLKLLCLVAIDPAFDCSRGDCRSCIVALVRSFPQGQYNTQACHLCDMVRSLCVHHHTMYYLADLLPTSHHLQRWVAYCMICHILGLPCNPCSQRPLQIEWLLPVLGHLTPESDSYVAMSLVQLLRMAVGNDHLDQRDTNALARLNEGISVLSNKKDSINNVNRSKLYVMFDILKCMWRKKLPHTSLRADILGTLVTPVKVKDIESNTPSADNQPATQDMMELPDLDRGHVQGRSLDASLKPHKLFSLQP